MNYALYLDKPSDCESNKDEWVVQVFSFQSSSLKVKKSLNTCFKGLPSHLNCAIHNFHLAGFRTKFGHAKAEEMVSTKINTFENAIPYNICLVQ